VSQIPDVLRSSLHVWIARRFESGHKLVHFLADCPVNVLEFPGDAYLNLADEILILQHHFMGFENPAEIVVPKFVGLFYMLLQIVPGNVQGIVQSGLISLDRRVWDVMPRDTPHSLFQAAYACADTRRD